MTLVDQEAEDVCRSIEDSAIWRATCNNISIKRVNSFYLSDKGQLDCKAVRTFGGWVCVWSVGGIDISRCDVVFLIKTRLESKGVINNG